MDVMEVLRLLRAGTGDREMAKMLRHNRRTMAKYRRWAQHQGLLTGDLPAPAALHHLLATTFPEPRPPQQTSSLAAYAAEIAAYRAQGVEMTAIRARLEERHQHPVSYSAVRRLVRRLEPPPREREVYVRVEVPPGSEAQVDFGSAGRMFDPRTGQERKAWVFVLVLSWSRHLYAEFVFDQRAETWLQCHRHAFEAFGGVPARIVPDNLKAAILKASFLEPVAQRSYRECAEHYGFLIDPQPPRAPHLKGKVEQGGVHYLKRNFLAGRPPQPLDEANHALQRWVAQIAGQRVHGTTKQRPLDRFRTVEQATLRPLPVTPYDPAVWKQARVYRDCYITFEQAYYSVPFRLVGQQVWVRGGSRTVEVYTSDHALVATHDRARTPGHRQTHVAHLPPGKVPGLTLTRASCRAQAVAIGPATTTLVQRLLAHRPEDRLRVAGRLVRLAHTYSPERLERAGARALHFGAADYVTVKRILQAGLDQQPLPPAPRHPPAHQRYTFVRQASEFVASLLGASTWGGNR